MIKIYNKIMRTIEIKQHLQNDKMITESEEDIKAGRVYDLEETQNIINSWNN